MQNVIFFLKNVNFKNTAHNIISCVCVAPEQVHNWVNYEGSKKLAKEIT